MWTGSEMVAWGGTDIAGPAKDDGASYEPSTDDWTNTPSAPIAGRHDQLAVASDGAMVIWGSTSGPMAQDDGAAYHPLTRKWAKLPEAPIPGRTHSAATAIEHGVMVWGGESRDGDTTYFNDGAVLRPVDPGE